MKVFRATFFLATVLLVTSCGTSPPSRFYTLDPIYHGPPVADLAGVRIGTGPFDLPDLLDRPAIVVRGPGNEVIINEFARWADDLHRRFQSVLMRNLVVATGSKNILEYPWRDELDVDFAVTGFVDVFSADTTGKVQLIVRWMIVDGKSGENLEARESVYVETADPDDFGDIAAAMSRTAASFSVDIADEIGKLATANR